MNPWQLRNEVEGRTNNVSTKQQYSHFTKCRVTHLPGPENETFSWGSRNEKMLLCRVAHHKTEQPYMQCPLPVFRPDARLSLIKSKGNVLGAQVHAYPGRMDILPSRPFEVYVGNLLAKPILLTKDIVFA